MKTFLLASVASLCGLVAVGACSDDPAADPAKEVPDASAGDASEASTTDTNPEQTGLPKAGSRLSPRFLTTTDGFKAHVGIFDTKLDTICIASKRYDDAIRCVPIVNHSVTNLSYSDAACTKPVVDVVTQSAGQCEAHKYVDLQVTPGTGCQEGRTALYKIVTAKVDLPKSYVKDGNGACNEAGAAASFTEVALVPGAELVKLTEAIDPISGQIGTEVLAGEDGSRFGANFLIDRARSDAQCRATMGNDDKPRCVPASGAVETGFADVGCTQATYAFLECGKQNDPNAKYVTRLETKDCKSKSVVSELGAKRASKNIFSGTPTNCTGPNQHTSDVYDLGPEVSPALFPELTALDIGGTRIVSHAFKSADQVVSVESGTLVDKTQNGECSFETASDGKVRCLPISISVLFSDATCQTAVGAQFPSDCGTPKTARGLASTCPTKTTIYALGAPIAGTKAYYKTTNDCLEIGVKTMYTLGAEVAPGTFAEGTYVPK